MATAYYELASIYRDKLDNPQKAAKTLETLIKKVPDNLYLLQSYYGLYLFYKVQKTSYRKRIQPKNIRLNFLKAFLRNSLSTQTTLINRKRNKKRLMPFMEKLIKLSVRNDIRMFLIWQLKQIHCLIQIL